VNDVALGQLVEHRSDNRQLNRSDGSIGHRTECTNRITSRLVKELVVNSLGLDLADAFQRGFMISHWSY